MNKELQEKLCRRLVLNGESATDMLKHAAGNTTPKRRVSILLKYTPENAQEHGSGQSTRQSMLSCPSCLKRFNKDENVPKILSCFHEVCKSCCDNLFSNEELCCPKCGTPTILKSKDEIDQLKTDEMTKQLATITAQCETVEVEQNQTPTRQHLCGYCEEASALPAKWVCAECTSDSVEIAGLPLCDDCKVVHSKARVFKAHPILDIDEYCSNYRSPCRSKALKSENCKFHTNKIVEFVCDSCSDLVCQSCVTGTHAGHKLELLSEKATATRLEIKSICDDLTRTSEELSCAIIHVQDSCHKFESCVDHLLSDVDASCDDLIAAINTQRGRAKEQVKSIASKAVFDLEYIEKNLTTGSCLLATHVEVAEQVVQESDSALFKRAEDLKTTLRQIHEEQKQQLQALERLEVADVEVLTPHHSQFQELIPSLFQPQRSNAPSQQEQQQPPQPMSPMSPPHSCPSTPSSIKGAQGQGQGQADHRTIGLTQLGNVSDVDLLFTDEGLSLLYVADSSNHCVQVFDVKTGVRLKRIGFGRGAKAGQLDCPFGVALQIGTGGSEELYVTEKNGHRVQCFNALTGAYLRSIGSGRGSGRGQLSSPHHLALTSPFHGGEKLIFVADHDNHRVQVYYARTGAYVRTIGSGLGPGAGQMDGPVGLALMTPTTAAEAKATEGMTLLFVADSGNHRVNVFDALTGSFLRCIGEGGAEPSAELGRLDTPHGLEVHALVMSQGECRVLLFVAEYGNQRIQVFDAVTGQHVRLVDAPRAAPQQRPYSTAVAAPTAPVPFHPFSMATKPASHSLSTASSPSAAFVRQPLALSTSCSLNSSGAGGMSELFVADFFLNRVHVLAMKDFTDDDDCIAGGPALLTPMPTPDTARALAPTTPVTGRKALSLCRSHHRDEEDAGADKDTPACFQWNTPYDENSPPRAN